MSFEVTFGYLEAGYIEEFTVALHICGKLDLMLFLTDLKDLKVTIEGDI